MTTDNTTKALLLAIALGLWANVATNWVRPTVAHAQSRGLDLTESTQLKSIEKEVTAISWGTCRNSAICRP